MQIRRFITLLVLMVFSFALKAQVKFYTLVTEQQVSVGQPFQVQYVSEGSSDVQSFSMPDFANFNILESFESKSTSFTSPGLKMIDVYSRIVVLSAKKTGKFTIAGASAIIDGKKMRSNSLRIRILPRIYGSQSIVERFEEEVPVERLSELRPSENIEKKINENLFVRASASKTSCYEGEDVMLTYKLYSRLNNTAQILKRPSLTGLSVVEMVDSYDSRPEIEKLNGVPYYVNLIRKVQGFPLQAGRIDLDVAQISSLIHFVKVTETRSSNRFDDLLANRQRTGYDHPVTLTSNPLAIEVKPLPVENQPAAFTGAVGQFNLNITIPKTELHTGDLVKIQVILDGAGNIPLLVPPIINWPSGVDTAEPIVKEEFDKYSFPLKGHKIFEYSFTAPEAGQYIIPATDYYYFNPTTRGYEKSESDSIVLTIKPAVGRKPIEENNQPLAFVRGKVPLQLYWFAAVVVLIVAWVIIQVMRARKESRVKKSAIVQNVQLPVTKPNRLENARRELEQGDTVKFYQEVQQAIWLVVADTVDVLPSRLNKRNVATLLETKGVSSATISDLLLVLNECEWALYVPDLKQQDGWLTFARAEAVIESISS
ncbi:MAG: protein BatD [Chitinophagaceae bacterium]|nr:protein BatD [Chitinophagaceae bacterium]